VTATNGITNDYANNRPSNSTGYFPLLQQTTPAPLRPLLACPPHDARRDDIESPRKCIPPHPCHPKATIHPVKSLQTCKARQRRQRVDSISHFPLQS
jgi:hypothetical protein